MRKLLAWEKRQIELIEATQRMGHNDAARKLYSLCCSAPVVPIYRLNGIELDGFECAVCQNRCEKVGCVPSFYESGK